MIVTEAGFIAQGVLANMLHFRVASTVVRTQHSNDKVQFTVLASVTAHQ